jgi:HK97 family phage prohead protease
MNAKRETKAVKIKSAEYKVDIDNRTIEMYSSVFENEDLYGDIIHKGAFSQSLDEHKKSDGSWRIPLLWQHMSHFPIGKPTVLFEDEKGLFSKDSIPKTGEGTKAEEALILAYEGVIEGASIGYFSIDERWDGNIRHLTRLDIFERSLVTFPANELAGVVGVQKSLARLSPQLANQVGAGLLSVCYDQASAALKTMQDITSFFEKAISDLDNSETTEDNGDRIASVLSLRKSFSDLTKEFTLLK